MSCQEGASYLGLSKSAFWSKCRSGEIPHIRISSRCYRVRQSDLETYLNSRTR
jgi:excisionase family DNA binding protein